METTRLLTAEETAAILELTKSYVCALAREGRLPSVTGPTERYLFRAEDVEAEAARRAASPDRRGRPRKQAD